MISASRIEFSQKTKPGRPRSAPRNPFPVKKTKVATKTEEFRVPKLTRTRTGWCEGVVIEYNPNHAHPYRIEWNNDPKVQENCTLDEMNLLTHHYRECDKRRLLDIDCVGKEILEPLCPSICRIIVVFVQGTMRKYLSYNCTKTYSG